MHTPPKGGRAKDNRRPPPQEDGLTRQTRLLARQGWAPPPGPQSLEGPSPHWLYQVGGPSGSSLFVVQLARHNCRAENSRTQTTILMTNVGPKSAFMMPTTLQPRGDVDDISD